ncbi:MAG: hypothetical protein ACR2OV_00275 [Hyphomicrobiaceae bacterium]
MPMRSVQKPYTITLKRTIEIEMTHYATSGAKARKWADEYGMDDLQHEGEIMSDICKIASVRPR